MGAETAELSVNRVGLDLLGLGTTLLLDPNHYRKAIVNHAIASEKYGTQHSESNTFNRAYTHDSVMIAHFFGVDSLFFGATGVDLDGNELTTDQRVDGALAGTSGLLVLTLVVASPAMVGAASAGGPSGSVAYVPPSVLRAGRPGLVLLESGEVALLGSEEFLAIVVEANGTMIMIPAGSAGELGYLCAPVEWAAMAGQELDLSCAAAAARQLLAEEGVIVTEAELRAIMNYGRSAGHVSIGIQSSDAAAGLTEFHPRFTFAGGSTLNPMQDLRFMLSRGNTPIVYLKPSGKGGFSHAVIVDGIEENIVIIRDPWPILGPGNGPGTAAIMEIEVFELRWQSAGHQIVFPIRLK